ALPRRTSNARPHFRHREARLVQLAAGGAMNGAVHAPAAEHPLVGRVDDRVDVERRDVGADDLDKERSSGRDTGMPGHGMATMTMTIAMPKKIIASRCLRAASLVFRIFTRAT